MFSGLQAPGAGHSRGGWVKGSSGTRSAVVGLPEHCFTPDHGREATAAQLLQAGCELRDLAGALQGRAAAGFRAARP